jgi:hypothetical protein
MVVVGCNLAKSLLEFQVQLFCEVYECNVSKGQLLASLSTTSHLPSSRILSSYLNANSTDTHLGLAIHKMVVQRKIVMAIMSVVYHINWWRAITV